MTPSRPPTPAVTGLTQGRDFAFLDVDDHDHPYRWRCDETIQVRLAGPTPPGAGTALTDAVTKYVTVTHLPLVIASDLPEPVLKQPNVEAGEITVTYLNDDEAAQVGMSDTTLGLGGALTVSSAGHEELTSGWVTIKADTASTDPRTQSGQLVLLHELGHALGLGHAAQTTPNIMTPVLQPNLTGFGSGDLAGLARLGCARQIQDRSVTR